MSLFARTSEDVFGQSTIGHRRIYVTSFSDLKKIMPLLLNLY